jgi:hypothetical protein
VLPESDRARDLKAFYEREGYAGPFTAVEPEELSSLRILPQLEALRAGAGADDCTWGRNRHLDVPAIAEICRLDSVVRRVTAVLGRDLLLWRSQIFGMAARAMGLEWHRDEYDTLLRCPAEGAHCSVQINLVTSTKINCLAIIPRSHSWDVGGLRARGYTAGPGVLYPEWRIPRDAEVLDMPMRAGEFFIFHPRLLHASVWSRTLRLAGGPAFANNLARWSRSVAAALTPRTSLRYAITLRIATPDTAILPAAFVRTPSRASPVVLSGTDAFGVNRVGGWAGNWP